MKKIFIRSPYFIEINEPNQTKAKVELFFYNKGTAVPSTPTKILIKNIPSVLQSDLSFNISNYAKYFIKPITTGSGVIVPTPDDVLNWCYVLVKRYSDDVFLDSETIVCLNGYSKYSDGYNLTNNEIVVNLFNPDIKKRNEKYINVWIDSGLNTFTYTKGVESYTIEATGDIYALPIGFNVSNKLQLVGGGGAIYFDITPLFTCDAIYTPVNCAFINRLGGWENLTFYKAKTDSFETKNKEVSLLPSALNYNPLQGQRQRFNFQGTRKTKVNTGFVDENYSELLEELVLSEVVLLDLKPVLLRSSGFEIKTKLKDNNINYELDFEYNFGIINDVI